MSLINQMLKDLEARKQQGVANSSQQVEVVASQPINSNNTRLVVWTLIGALVVCLGGGLWWLSKLSAVVLNGSILQTQPVQIAETVATLEPPVQSVEAIEPTIDHAAEQDIVFQSQALQIPKTVEPIIFTEQSVTEIVINEIDVPPVVHGSIVDNVPAVAASEPSPVVLEESLPAAVATLVIEPPSLTEQGQQLRFNARELAQQQRYPSALHMYNQAMLIDGGSARQWQEFVRMCVQAKDLPRAMDVALRGCEKFPNDVALRVYRARLIVESGDYSAALVTLQSGQTPKVEASSDYYALLASVLQQLGKFDDAGQQYAVLTAVHPQRGDWWIGRAICADQLGASQQAADYYQQAMTCQQLSPQLKQFAVEQLVRLSKG